jgi:RimJ/RimL family protein N-acetyltransferase
VVQKVRRSPCGLIGRRSPAAFACQHGAVPPTDVPVISDGVITLRPWVPEDASFLGEASADPAIQRYSLSRSQPFTAVEAQAQLRDRGPFRLTTDAVGRPSGPLVIVDAVTGLPLGQCGIDGWSPADVAQIGYWLTPKARGRGIATRAVLQLTHWLFDLGASRVFLTVVEDNLASIRVAERAGFLSEGPNGEQTVWNGRCHEVLRFAVTAENWKRRG